MKKVLFLMEIKARGTSEYSSAITQWYGILEKLGYEVYYEDYTEYNPEELYKLVKSNKPDFIFHPTYENFHTEFARLREFSKVYCLHSDDDWRFDNYAKYWIPFTDGAIGFQNHSEAYEREGASKNYYIRGRWAFNPNTMLHTFEGPKAYRLTHLGGLHGGKAQRIEQLKAMGLKIELIDPKFSSYSYYLESFYKSVGSICLTNNSLGSAKQSKTRVGETPYYCTLVSEPWPNMELWNMEPNKDFILLDDTSNSIELVNKLLNDEVFAKGVYERGKEVLLNFNTAFHEWNKVMLQIDEDYKPIDINRILKEYNL